MNRINQNSGIYLPAGKSGFSLVEILIVITIIGIISGVGLSAFSSIQRSTRDAQRESDLRVLQTALQQYYADNNKYPNTLPVLSTGASITNCTGYLGTCPPTLKTYLSSTPKDPSGTAYYYLPFYNANSSQNCDGTQGVCHYYKLCAVKENEAAGTLCNSTYNFQVTPL